MVPPAAKPPSGRGIRAIRAIRERTPSRRSVVPPPFPNHSAEPSRWPPGSAESLGSTPSALPPPRAGWRAAPKMLFSVVGVVSRPTPSPQPSAIIRVASVLSVLSVRDLRRVGAWPVRVFACGLNAKSTKATKASAPPARSRVGFKRRGSEAQSDGAPKPPSLRASVSLGLCVEIPPRSRHRPSSVGHPCYLCYPWELFSAEVRGKASAPPARSRVGF